MYEGLPIATNKISAEERRNVPHHLLGCIKLNEAPWTVTKFRQNATQVAEQIRSRGKVPIVVGGTHYYAQSLLFKDALVDNGPGYMTVEEQEKRWPILGAGSAEMLQELNEIDPVMAQRWHPNDVRKIRRSLEIYLTTGRKASEIYEEQLEQRAREGDATNCHADDIARQALHQQDYRFQPESAQRYDSLIFWTHAEPETLKRRLDDRVDTMLRNGLLSEVESLYQHQQEQQIADPEADLTRGIWIAIGYKEFLPYLLATKDGNTSEKELERLKLDGIERTQIRTRQYAKSQIRWIRGKLLTALRRENLTSKIFQLDASDLAKWEESVMFKAEQIATAFLAGSVLPEPSEYLGIADSMNKPSKDQDHYARHCEVCNKIMTTADAWEVHSKSRKHKMTARCKQKKHKADSLDGEMLSLDSVEDEK